MGIVDWQFILCDTATMTKIEVLDQASSRNLEIISSRPGSLGFSIPLDDEKAHLIEKQKTAIRAVRNGSTKWSGPVYSRILNGQSNTMTVGCLGWLEDLYKRIIRVGQDAVINAISNPSGGAEVQDIIYGLLDLAHKQRTGTIDAVTPINVDGTSGDIASSLRPPRVSQGTATLTDVTNYPAWPAFQIAYTRGQKIGEMIQQLSDIENGVDLEVDVDSKELNLYYPRRSVDRPGVAFGFNREPRNLIDFVRNEDSGQSCQRFNTSGRVGTYMAENTDVMDDLGIMFEEEETLSDVTESDVLLAYSGAEVTIRERGLTTDQITLFPYSDEEDQGDNVPQLFVDYDIGDTVRVSADLGFYQVRNQKMRIYGAKISIDDAGNEKVESVQTSPVGA